MTAINLRGGTAAELGNGGRAERCGFTALNSKLDLTNPVREEVDIGPFPWEEAFGRWAVDLEQAGLVEARVKQGSRLLRPSHGDEDAGEKTAITTTTTIIFDPSCARLYELLFRSLGPESAAGESGRRENCSPSSPTT